jgi:hypothetical protein
MWTNSTNPAPRPHIINTFMKVAGYKTHTKIIAFLYTINEHTKKELRKKVQFFYTWRETGV